jgi:RimJ/RimL family protein N-acetyltransferase
MVSLNQQNLKGKSDNIFGKHQIGDLLNSVIAVDNQIIIRQPREDDLKFLKKLWIDPKVMNYLGFPRGMKVSDEKIISWINSGQESGQLRLLIEDSVKKVPIGEIGYREDKNFPFTHKNSVLALDIKIIPDYWGKGIAKKTLKKFVDNCRCCRHRSRRNRCVFYRSGSCSQ